jgi:hypothetical protein
MLRTDTLRTPIGLALISAGSIAFEISLTRIFAIQQFHHFAFVVVSLAVMGIAASGLILALRPGHPPLATLSFAYAISVAAAYLTINFLPFDSFSIAWDSRQVWILLLYFLTAGAPFLFAGWTVGACLAEAGTQAHRPYAANLIGSALGCPAALITLSILGSEGAVASAAILGLVAAIIFASTRTSRLIYTAAAGALFFVGLRTPEALTLRLSPYKPLSISRHAPDAVLTLSRSSPSTRVDVVEGSSIHVLPGLSLNARIQMPRQAALFLDGDGPLPISELSPDDPQTQRIAQHMPASLAYLLRPGAHALILQPGAGLDAIIALATGAANVTVAFEEPLTVEILESEYANFTHFLLKDSRLTLSPYPGRGTLQQGEKHYDIIQFALSDGFRPVTSGAFSLMENYILTLEAFSQAFARLQDDGLLVITRWLGTPPSESARVWSTMLKALEEQAVADPTKHLIAFRGMRTSTLMVSHQPIPSSDLETVRTFLAANNFDPIFLPDLDPQELNRFNQLAEDTYHQIFSDLLQDHSTTIAAYDFNLSPPTDERPFFFHFFRWRQTPEVLARLGLTWQPFGGSGYLVLLALLGLMLILAIPMALAPLYLKGRSKTRSPLTGSTLLYFACLGAGYLLVEIPLIQQFSLLLDRPVNALAAVLFTLLFASGFGSMRSPHHKLRRILLVLVMLLGVIIASIPTLIQWTLAWPLAARLLLVVGLLTPAGFLMGIPFASGLRDLQERSPGSIPWAWAVNGAVSGVSGVAAAMISLDFGFQTTMIVGAAAYFLAWLAVSRREAASQA